MPLLKIKPRIRCYDNGGKTFDRYTVVYLHRLVKWKVGVGMLYESRSMSEHPTRPNGYGLYDESIDGGHLGKRISFNKLPPDCQALVNRDLTDTE